MTGNNEQIPRIFTASPLSYLQYKREHFPKHERDYLTRLYLPRSGMVEKASVVRCDAGPINIFLKLSISFFD
jgi:hypothetical protein